MGLKVILFTFNVCKYERKKRRKVRLSVTIFKQEILNIHVVKRTIFLVTLKIRMDLILGRIPGTQWRLHTAIKYEQNKMWH
jgi:hypothetical protein